MKPREQALLVFIAIMAAAALTVAWLVVWPECREARHSIPYCLRMVFG